MRQAMREIPSSIVTVRATTEERYDPLMYCPTPATHDFRAHKFRSAISVSIHASNN
jgi:hypothetical protein